MTFPASPQPVELRFQAFAPPFTSTNLFPVVLLLLALVVVAFLLWWKLPRGKAPEAPEPPEETPPTSLEEPPEPQA